MPLIQVQPARGSVERTKTTSTGKSQSILESQISDSSINRDEDKLPQGYTKLQLHRELSPIFGSMFIFGIMFPSVISDVTCYKNHTHQKTLKIYCFFVALLLFPLPVRLIAGYSATETYGIELFARLFVHIWSLKVLLQAVCMHWNCYVADRIPRLVDSWTLRRPRNLHLKGSEEKNRR